MGALTEVLNEFGENTVTIIRDNMRNTGTDASGRTSASLRHDMIKPNRVQVSGKPFIYVVETGRKAGKMPPVSKILSWIETGKPSFSGSKIQFAWAISRTIAKLGSRLFRKGGRKDIITPAISDERVNKLVADVADISLSFYFKAIEDGTKPN